MEEEWMNLNWTEWTLNEWLFYGGIALAVSAVLLFFIYLLISLTAKHRLRERMTQEYGENSVKKR